MCCSIQEKGGFLDEGTNQLYSYCWELGQDGHGEGLFGFSNMKIICKLTKVISVKRWDGGYSKEKARSG